jgi:hypothetical protein
MNAASTSSSSGTGAVNGAVNGAVVSNNGNSNVDTNDTKKTKKYNDQKFNDFKNQSVEYTEVQVFLNTNIPGVKSPIELTSSLLYIPPKKVPKASENKSLKQTQQVGKKGGADVQENEEQIEPIDQITYDKYPRIPTNHALDMDFLNTLPYENVVGFFFSESYFQKKMGQWGFSKANEIRYNYNAENIEEQPLIPGKIEKAKLALEKKNLEIMIRLLFPTHNLNNEGYKTSMQYWNNGERYNMNYFPKSDNMYSYIKHSGQIYTISNAVWLNDVFHVNYWRDLSKYYGDYKKWIANNKHQFDNYVKSGGKEEVIAMIDKYVYNSNGLVSRSEWSEYRSEFSQRQNQIPAYIKSLFNPENKGAYIYSVLYDSKKRVFTKENDTLNNTLLEGDEKNSPATIKFLLDRMHMFKTHGGKTEFLAGETPEDRSALYYVGLHKKAEETQWHITVMLDVIKGKVDQSNFYAIRCRYFDEWLGKMIEFQTKKWPSWNILRRRIYMSVDPAEKIVVEVGDKTTGSELEGEPQYSFGDYAAANVTEDDLLKLIINMPAFKNSWAVIKDNYNSGTLANEEATNKNRSNKIKPPTVQIPDVPSYLLRFISSDKKYPDIKVVEADIGKDQTKMNTFKDMDSNKKYVESSIKNFIRDLTDKRIQKKNDTNLYASKKNDIKNIEQQMKDWISHINTSLPITVYEPYLLAYDFYKSFFNKILVPYLATLEPPLQGGRRKTVKKRVRNSCN